jgi:immunity protein 10 of polymorphic toxin system
MALSMTTGPPPRTRISGLRYKAPVTLQLTARVAAFVAEDDNDVLFAGVAEHPDGSGWSLLFQGGSPDPDEPTGDEDYCLVTETAACVYGGVDGVTLNDNRLLLSLEAGAADDLELPTSIEITLDTDAAQIARFRDGLARIFATTSLDCRPRHLELPGAEPAVEARPADHRPAPRGSRVEYVVVEAMGALVITETITPSPDRDAVPADHLARQLGVEPTSLVGRRYSCLSVTDRFGTTLSDFQLT